MMAVLELAPVIGKAAACDALAVPRASFYRRRARNDRPCQARPARPRPGRALSEQQRQGVLDVLHSERFVDKSPAEVRAALLDEGRYLCSERTMYRILADADELRERRNQLRHPQYKKPELLAIGPNEVWSWDITKLLGPAKWTYYYLYVILDIFSRYAVGWMLASCESAQLAERLIRETIENQGVVQDQLVMHSDRGPSMKSHDVAQLLATLGVTKSHSRPHVSNDNPFSESQFKTLKYRPEFPDRFGSQQDAHAFCQSFFGWYNHEHYHSGIRMLTPAMVHYGSAQEVLLQRQEVLDAAYAAHPERFVNGRPSPGQLPQQVWINPPPQRSEQHKPTERTNNPLGETQPGFLVSGTKSEFETPLLTSTNDLGRPIAAADLDSSLDKTFTQITTNTAEQSVLPPCLTPVASETRYTNFASQLSQTR